MQNELQQEEQKLVNEIGQRMISIIDEFAKANTFAVVSMSPPAEPRPLGRQRH